MGRSELEPPAGVPGEVPDAIAQMVEKRDRPKEQEQYPNRRSNKGMGCRKYFATCCHRNSHHASRIEPTASAIPASRCRIDRAELIWKRYQTGNMNGDTGRSILSLPLT